jgi:hypothetical protein
MWCGVPAGIAIITIAVAEPPNTSSDTPAYAASDSMNVINFRFSFWTGIISSSTQLPRPPRNYLCVLRWTMLTFCGTSGGDGYDALCSPKTILHGPSCS